MKKLKDHPKFPKEKEGNTERNDYTGNCDDDYENGCENGEIWGYNQALKELGEIEILEELDEGKVYKLLSEWAKGNNAIPEMLGFRRKLASAICQRFGTRKVSQEEIEKICFDFYYNNQHLSSTKGIRTLADTLVSYINEGA